MRRKELPAKTGVSDYYSTDIFYGCVLRLYLSQMQKTLYKTPLWPILLLIPALLWTCTKKTQSPSTHPAAGAPGDLPAVPSSLSERRIVSRPVIRDTTSKTGVVVLYCCVDQAGNVVRAEYQAKGSTTTDEELVSKSIDALKKWKFAPAVRPEEQCGTMTFRYALK